MKTLKHGKKDERWVGECRECNAIVLAETDEIEPIVKDPENSNGDFGLADCPDCGEENGVIFYRLRSITAKKLCRTNDIDILKVRHGYDGN